MLIIRKPITKLNLTELDVDVDLKKMNTLESESVGSRSMSLVVNWYKHLRQIQVNNLTLKCVVLKKHSIGSCK